MGTGSRIHQSEAPTLDFESGAVDTETLSGGGSSCSKTVFPWQQWLMLSPSCAWSRSAAVSATGKGGDNGFST